ncbi:MAG: DNA repair protein RecO, partial [Planctomycetota bacterium]
HPAHSRPLRTMPLARDQAVCLRTLGYSETSQIVTLLTREHGRVRLMAKGARRTTKAGKGKFDGGLDLLDVGHALFNHLPEKELSLLTEWKLEAGHLALRKDLRAIYLGLYCAEVVDRLIEEHDPHPRLYDQLVRLLERLAGESVREAVALAFVLNVLRQTGVLPDFRRTTDRRSLIDVAAAGEPLAFDGERAEFIAGEAADDLVRMSRSAVAVQPGAIRAIVDLLSLARTGGGLPEVSRDAADAAHRLLTAHIQYQTGSKLRMARYVLDQL